MEVLGKHFGFTNRLEIRQFTVLQNIVNNVVIFKMYYFNNVKTFYNQNALRNLKIFHQKTTLRSKMRKKGKHKLETERCSSAGKSLKSSLPNKV